MANLNEITEESINIAVTMPINKPTEECIDLGIYLIINGWNRFAAIDIARAYFDEGRRITASNLGIIRDLYSYGDTIAMIKKWESIGQTKCPQIKTIRIPS